MNLSEVLPKILSLTESPVDSEALAAIRKANKVLADTDLTWQDVIRPSATQSTEDTQKIMHLKRDNAILEKNVMTLETKYRNLYMSYVRNVTICIIAIIVLLLAIVLIVI